MAVRLTLHGSDAASLDNATVHVWPKKDGHFIKSNHEKCKDGGGDITVAGSLSWAGGALGTVVKIPFVAFPDPDALVEFKVFIHKSSHSAIPMLSAGHVQLEGTKFSRRTVVAAMCDAATYALNLNGSFSPASMWAVRDAFIDAFSLDDHGIEAVHTALRQASATPLDAVWFSPERLAADMGHQFEKDDGVEAFRLLYASIAAKSLIGSDADAFLRDIAGKLSISEAALAATRAEFTGNAHFEILGLKAGAPIGEIKAAYRRAVKSCHPDAVGHLAATQREAAVARFRRLTAAYDALLQGL